jgi:DNA repair/transcription protein MET18/MMS19
MGEISLVGIVNLMTGEKDPRNLMMVFSILKVVMMEWDITNHVEVCSIPPHLFFSPLIFVVAL